MCLYISSVSVSEPRIDVTQLRVPGAFHKFMDTALAW